MSSPIISGRGWVPDRERCPKCGSFAKLAKTGGLQRHTVNGQRINGTTKKRDPECQ